MGQREVLTVHAFSVLSRNNQPSVTAKKRKMHTENTIGIHLLQLSQETKESITTFFKNLLIYINRLI